MALVAESSMPSLTRARAIALLVELLEAFKSKSFQKKLGKLVSKSGGTSGASVSGPIRHVDGRRALVFAEQRDVLLKHGFSVDEEGVVAMKAALRAHTEDPKVVELSRAVRSQLRLPQMKLPEATPYASGVKLPLPASPDIPEASEAPSVPPASTPAPTLLSSRSVCVEQKMKAMTLKVTNPDTNQKMTISVPKPFGSGPTVADVKSAIAAHLGGGRAEGSVDPSKFQLVISNGGGVYGTRGDKEIVKLDRVLARGVNIAAAGV